MFFLWYNKYGGKMKIIFDYEFDSWNKTIAKCRANYYYANAQKKKEMEYVKWELIRQKIQPIKEYPIKITCYWHRKTKQMDIDNMSVKSALDQMQKSGILKNDNLNCITEIHHIYIQDTKNYLEMEIC